MNPRLTPAELDARLKFVVGCSLAGLMISTGRNTDDKNGNGIPDDEE